MTESPRAADQCRMVVVVNADGQITNYFSTNLDLDEVVEMCEVVSGPLPLAAYEEYDVPIEIARAHMNEEQLANYIARGGGAKAD